MNIQRIVHKLRYYWFDLLSPKTVAPADEEVDIIIPVTSKDLKILPLALEGVRNNVNHRIAAIYIVARREAEIEAFCKEHDVTFIDECEVLGYGPRDIALMAGNPPRDRSGWIFQQLLKLSGKIGTAPYFITIDADHILLRPHTFITVDGRQVFYRSKECHKPYFENIYRLTGRKVASKLSYIAHKMVFERNSLCKLREEIEQHNPGLTWDQAIIASLDRNEGSGFSEFELYGNFVADEMKISMPFRNHHLTGKHLCDFDTLIKKYARKFAAITFPDYL